MTYGKDSHPGFGAARMSRSPERPEEGAGGEAVATPAAAQVVRQAPAKPARAKRKPPAAFDQWLARGLHQLFDDVAREPIPEDLLKLIEDDEKTSGG